MPRHWDGILSDPAEFDGPRRRTVSYPNVEAMPGLWVEHRDSGLVGPVVRMATGIVFVKDGLGLDRPLRALPGAFLIEGKPVTLVPPGPRPAAAATATRTASGSKAVVNHQARVARASRILVEGIHDAELVEKVWGDDLRVEGVVVERLDGMDHLPAAVAALRPDPGRRLGVLLDHLVEGSKEWRMAKTFDSDAILITGTPYIDVWQAVKPAVVGIPAWPTVPRGQPWKEGVCAALGRPDPGRFWKEILASVRSWTDLETPLVNAVERLIDFVCEPGS